MRNNHLPIFYFLLTIILIACSGEKKEIESEEGISAILPDTKNNVNIVVLKKEQFYHELISNGKIVASEMADLRFQTTEQIAYIWVKNGDHVRKGQKIAQLDKFRLNNKLTQTKDALEHAELELQDVLIGQGYGQTDRDKIPAEIMQLAKVKSGYDQNKAQYELAKYEDESATLTAPFDGVIANLFSKLHNTSSTSEPFCTIIDSQGMEVDFTVLENELSLIKKGDKVIISPYSDVSSRYNGSILEINPLVDDKGMVKVKACIVGNSGLFTGMNVRVSVHRSLEEQLIVPKSSVVLRSGKQVIFTVVGDKAYWNYVKTGLENAEYYTIIEGLKEGDIVIIDGNINLAHETPVNAIYN